MEHAPNIKQPIAEETKEEQEENKVPIDERWIDLEIQSYEEYT